MGDEMVAGRGANGAGREADEAPSGCAPRRKGGRPATHNLRALRVLVRQPLDGRSELAKAVARFRSDLIRDLGGEAVVSRAQLSVIEVCSRTWLMLSSIDDWLLKQPSLIDRRHRRLLPVTEQRQRLADSLLRHLTALGLERKVKDNESIRRFLTGPGPKAPRTAVRLALPASE